MDMVIVEMAIKYFSAHWFVMYLVTAWLLLIGFFFYATVTRSWRRLKIGIKILVAPVVVLFGALDVLFDFIFGSIMFFALPGWLDGRFTFSQRCEYYWDAPGLRGVIADAHCFLLNSILPGHCTK